MRSTIKNDVKNKKNIELFLFVVLRVFLFFFPPLILSHIKWLFYASSYHVLCGHQINVYKHPNEIPGHPSSNSVSNQRNHNSGSLH